MTALLTLIISSLANIFLALLVYVKNPRQQLNRTFAGLALSLVGLSFATYTSLHTTTPLPFIRLTMVFAVMLVLMFRWFSLCFPSGVRAFGRARWLELLAACAVVAIMVSPLTFTGVHIAHGGNVQPTFGAGILAFVLIFVYMVGGGLRVLFRRFRHAQGKERSQLSYMIAATIFLFSVEFISSLIVPLLFKVSIGVAYSSVYFVAFAAIITIAIVKRQLFDIRAVVARSVTYLLLLATLVIVYAVALFVISALFFSSSQVSRQYRIVNVALAILLAFTFPYLKQFFDRLTRRIFYHEAYDAQAVMQQLTAMLVSSTALDAIMRQSLDMLAGSIGISRAMLLVVDDGRTYRTKTYGAMPATEEPDIRLLQRIHTDLQLVDDLGNNATKTFLTGLDAQVVIRLRTTDATVGFLLAGAKNSGISYTAQDRELLQIAGRALAVAVNNALLYEKVQHFNRHLQEKVVDATKELRRTNDKLKALDETKDDFISMASHQLRTPLTSVKGYLSLVLEGDAGKLNEQQHKLLAQSFASSQRMVYLISDLLNVSRLRTGKFIIEPAPINLAEIITDEIEQLQETAATRSLTLKYEKPADFPQLMLDETKTRQVIMNFIDNAIYYTPAGGRIDVQLLNKPSTVELRVIDNGMGVPKSEQHHLFTKFYRAGNARKARPDGTGLGLFMAKKVITSQGGALIFESQENKGSTFGFTFSKSKLAVPAIPKPHSEPVAVA